MSIEKITADVIRVTAEMYGVPEETITAETRFVEDLSGDSLDGIEMVMAIEEKFDVEISDEEAEGLLSVADVADLVERKRA